MSKKKFNVVVDPRTMPPEEARARIDELLFQGRKPADKFDRAARAAFINTVLELMSDGRQLVQL